MPKSREFGGEAEPKQELSPNEDLHEVAPEIEPGNKAEAKPENLGDIEDLREKIEEAFLLEQPEKVESENDKLREEKVKAYQDEHLPKYLRKKPDFVSKAMKRFLTRGSKFETEGGENLPEKGPFIVICNHFGNGDTEAIMKTFKDFDLHFAVGKEWAGWDDSAVKRLFFKQLRMIPIEESLSNLTPQEKEEALSRQDKNGKRVFRRIINREKTGSSGNIDFIRQSIAALSRGDTLCVFPEGPFLNPHGRMNMKEKEEMKQGYRGIELIARWYKELTGEQLPIIPTAFITDEATEEKKLSIGEPLFLEDNDSELNGTDWCMTHVAQLLPEKQRGYYKDMISKND